MSRIHVVGFPHTGYDSFKYTACAFTARTVRMVKSWTMAGHEPIIYWAGDSTPESLEFVSCFSTAEMNSHFGEFSGDNLPLVGWDYNSDYWQTFHKRAITELKKRLRSNDMIALVGGSIAHEIVTEFKDQYTILEPGVGYEGICASDTFACFESYAWKHNRYGAYGIGTGRAFDTVIAHPLDAGEFSIGENEGYAAFIGRLIQLKGPDVAGQIAERAGLPLRLAGGGVFRRWSGNSVGGRRVEATDGTTIWGDHVEHVGSLNPVERRDFLSHAAVMLVPTLYIGPFETVHAEALLSGVPVVTPDYGVFTETVDKAFRYATMAEAVDATKRAVELSKNAAFKQELRESAVERFSIEACSVLYDKWFKNLETLRDGSGGFYA